MLTATEDSIRSLSDENSENIVNTLASAKLALEQLYESGKGQFPREEALDDLMKIVDSDRSQELTAKASLTAQFPDYKFDVKNQASFARWRPGRRPYSSTEHGVTDWLHTATAVGVRLDEQGQWQLFTPYGLDDLFNGIIRPTPAHIHNPDAESKATSFLQRCPCLRLIS